MKATALVAAVSLALSGALLAGCEREQGAAGGGTASSGSTSGSSGSMSQQKRSTSPSGAPTSPSGGASSGTSK